MTQPSLTLFRPSHAMQEEAELGVVMDNMSAGQELLRQKEDRLKVLENALLGGLVSYKNPNHHLAQSPGNQYYSRTPISRTSTL